MPEEFPPEWEYWEPDPEIAEVMAGREASATERFWGSFTDGVELRDIGFRKARLTQVGLQWMPLKLARYKPVRERTSKYLRRACENCGNGFTETKDRKVYCKACLPHQGTIKSIPRVLPCLHCDKPFTPKYGSNVMCSRSCASRWAVRNKVTVPLDDPGKGFCRECGVAMTPSRAVNGNEKTHCSAKCRQKGRNRRHYYTKGRGAKYGVPVKRPPPHLTTTTE